MPAQYLQYGCGTCAPPDWINFDSSLRLRMERAPVVGRLFSFRFGRLFPSNVHYGDIVNGLPIPAESCAGIYCSHVLEHIPRDQVSTAFLNTLRLLQPGGIFRLVVPDLRWRVDLYLEQVTSGRTNACDEFLESCMFRPRSPITKFASRIRDSYGNSGHLWMYDFETLAQIAKSAGFTKVRRCRFGDADDVMFSRVEDSARFAEGPYQELAIEATKPLQSGSGGR